MNHRTAILLEAGIKPEVIRYKMWGTAILLVVSVVGIVLIPLWLPILFYVLKRYYARLEIVLTRRDLKVRRGILNVEEKSIPLEKITDPALYQGPIMRLFDIKGMRVETAGQSAGGALVSIVGIDGVDEFRDAVLDQRDRVSDWQEDDAGERPASSGQKDDSAPDQTESLSVLTDIRDSLQRIERNLAGAASERE